MVHSKEMRRKRAISSKPIITSKKVTIKNFNECFMGSFEERIRLTWSQWANVYAAGQDFMDHQGDRTSSRLK
jgi:hypothetical protein